MEPDFLVSSYDYHLPEELIAQNPVVPRDHSRLLVVDSPNSHHHAIFKDLGDWLKPGDLLVMNNTKVIPARLYGQKQTGAPVEILLLEELSHQVWLSLVKPGKRFSLGAQIYFPSLEQPMLKATVIDRDQATGGRILKFEAHTDQSFWQLLENWGELPLPPYVKAKQAQPEQYQTIYAQARGAVAAPTAGLHFTSDLLDSLAAKGIGQTYLTLHVGVGTFRPVEVAVINEHQMHQEWLEVNQETVAQIVSTQKQGGRIIAVGTTVVRSLETAARFGSLQPFQGKTDLFIYPGFQFQVVQGLITNFHLPRSSLLMLVSALIGRERLLALYQEAIAAQYRFYSFGDAMLILPGACKVITSA